MYFVRLNTRHIPFGNDKIIFLTKVQKESHHYRIHEYAYRCRLFM